MPNKDNEKRGGWQKFLKWIGVDTGDGDEDGDELDQEEYAQEEQQRGQYTRVAGGQSERPTMQYQPGSPAGYSASGYQGGQTAQGASHSTQFTAYQGGRSQSQQGQAQGAQSQNMSNTNRGGTPVQFPSGEQSGKHNTNIYQLNEHGETKTVIDDLLTGKSVLINLQNLDAIESQRIIDTLSGAAYAINAKIKPVAHQAYLIAPASVEIGGNFNEEVPQGASANPQPQQGAAPVGTGTISSSLYRGGRVE